MKPQFRRLIVLAALLLPLMGYAQVGVGTATPDASAALEVRAANKGLLIPQVNLASLADAATVPTPATGLLVFNRNAALAGGLGFYFSSTLVKAMPFRASL